MAMATRILITASNTLTIDTTSTPTPPVLQADHDKVNVSYHADDTKYEKHDFDKENAQKLKEHKQENGI
ncbi:hypothetical protein BC936DRAFT_143448 [Jimgerdemannia flammicorona]|uniref:Uncharacterized protein n=1 Tax=Jimgerdemannia flammicorona TaxID=994334 RepID=A0A433DDW7_9FUNG|nr:hypothetical protein BC936DRAFT_143448 [Jimgerdemannia flammicorona]